MDNNIRLIFDKDADVLYVTSGEPEYTDYEEIGENLIIRRDPKTQKIVGFTAIDFAAIFANKVPAVSVPLRVKFERARNEHKTKIIADGKIRYRVKQRKKN